MRAAGEYRSDIDGLRTLAVVPVLLFHAGLAGVSGGYVGVDVFFVISGFLITGIILAEMERGAFRTRRFYERRIRRIFPALAAVLLATLAAGAVLLPPAGLADVARSALAAAAVGSNVFFWRSVDYFADSQAAQPLIHTWSLAVEEQFYIVFPPLLALLVRRRWPVAPVLAALALLSFGIAAAMVFVKPSATFYLPVTRAWELLAGALLATGAVRPPASARAAGWAGWLGIALIAVPVLAYDARTPFPGALALPPVIGAALAIWAGGGSEGRRHGAGRLLSARPMVAIGRVSYSLYLWHVPVLSYLAYVGGGVLGRGAAVAGVLASLLLAAASYRWIEQPFRAGGGRRVARPVLAGIAMMAAAVAVAAGLAATGGWPQRLDARGRTLVDVAADKTRFHVECLTVGETIVPPTRPCLLGTPGVAPTVLLWGDSHAMVTASAMERAARRHRRAFLFVAAADCPVGLGFSIDDGTAVGLTRTASYRYCGEYNRRMLDLALTSPGIGRVVLSSRWTNWRIGEPGNPAESPVDIRLRDAGGVAPSPAANAAIFARGFLRLLAALRAGGKEVVVVGPLPEPDFNVPQRLFVERFGGVPPAAPITLDRYRSRHRRILAFFARVEAAGLARFVWPASRLCRRDVCPIEAGGRPVFFDHDHLALAAARSTAGLYDPLFQAGTGAGR